MRLHVISKGIFHPSIFCRNALKKSLRKYQNVVYSNNIDSLNGIRNNTDAVLLYFHEKYINDKTLSSLISYVEGGGLLLCIHGALASFKEFPEYNKLTGSRFTGHGRIREIHAKGVMDFTIVDEPYEFELADDCTLLLAEGSLPVSWERKQGKGRVVCLVPGHKTKTMNNPFFKNMVQYILKEYS